MSHFFIVDDDSVNLPNDYLFGTTTTTTIFPIKTLFRPEDSISTKFRRQLHDAQRKREEADDEEPSSKSSTKSVLIVIVSSLIATVASIYKRKLQLERTGRHKKLDYWPRNKKLRSFYWGGSSSSEFFWPFFGQIKTRHDFEKNYCFELSTKWEPKQLVWILAFFCFWRSKQKRNGDKLCPPIFFFSSNSYQITWVDYSLTLNDDNNKASRTYSQTLSTEKKVLTLE